MLKVVGSNKDTIYWLDITLPKSSSRVHIHVPSFFSSKFSGWYRNTPLIMQSCRILWSTQSGRAKACARRTKRILTEQTTLQIEDVGSSFDETPEPFLEWVSSSSSQDNDDSSFLLLFVSTTGDGEHCDSIRETWKTLLSKSLPKQLLRGKKFAIFCLGDRAYGPQFCAAGRKLTVRLLQLGMSRCCEVGYGDDTTPSGGVFRDLDDWLEEQLLPLLEKSSSGNGSEASSLSSIPTMNNPFKISYAKEGANEVKSTSALQEDEWQVPSFQKPYQDYFTRSCPVTAYHYNPNTGRISEEASSLESSSSKQPPLLGTVPMNQRITTDDWEQDTRYIRIHLQQARSEESSSSSSPSEDTASLPYRAGDIATVLPFNSDPEVDRFLAVLPQHLQEVADQPLELEIDERLMNNSFCRWPGRFTLRGWLKYCADIHSLPEREDLRALSFFCSEEHEVGNAQRDKLRSLSDTSEAALYADYILREKRSWADVIYDFDSLQVASSKLSIGSLLVLLPSIRPRDFSIASAPSKDPHAEGVGFTIELCVAVVEGKTRLGREYFGLCSEYLSRIAPNKDGVAPLLLQVWIRPGSFGKLPLELSKDSTSFQTPIICVGAGTGVAPMRSLLLEREAIASTALSEQAPMAENNNILVFGCRKSTADYYFKEEWEGLHDRKRIRLLTAFSRDQFQKIYVQRVLREADGGSLIVKHLVERNGALYIAGGPQMARAVKEEVVEALAKEFAGGEKEAKLFLSKLQRLGKFSVEAWS
jgi:sulfite reductase alpha subunit-like flavoprotein